MIKIILVSVFYIMAIIALMLAVGFDARSRSAKNYKGWMALTFFFPIIVAIIYLCKRNSLKLSDKPVDEKSMKTKSKVWFVLFIAFVIAFAGLNVYDVIFNNGEVESAFASHYGLVADGATYYDMNGKEYSDVKDVPYYDSKGTQYHYTEKDGKECYTDDTVTIPYYKCFVDENGALFNNEKNELTIKSTANNFKVYQDKDGKVYYELLSTGFNKDGKLTDTNGKIIE